MVVLLGEMVVVNTLVAGSCFRHLSKQVLEGCTSHRAHCLITYPPMHASLVVDLSRLLSFIYELCIPLGWKQGSAPSLGNQFH